MKRLIALIIALCLILSGCGLLPQNPPQTGGTGDSDNSDNGSGSGDQGDTGDGGADGGGSGDQGGSDNAECTNGHSDEGDDGRCDNCGISLYVRLDFYVINDLHGKLVDSETQPGVDELTTYLKQMTAKDEHSVLFSSGDMWQGSSESNLTYGLMVTDWMNHLDFEAMTLGNHEFDWGEEYIEANAEAAEFPMLAINIYDRTTGKPVEYCAPSVLIERGGLQIGIIGAIGDCYSSISSDKVEDVYFKVGDELTALVKAEATRLRQLGADYIVYSLHDGYGSSSSSEKAIYDRQLSSYYDPQLSDGYVDLVFEGHTHQRYVMYDSHRVYHLQNGGENKGICHVEVDVNSVTGTSFMREKEFVSSYVYEKMDSDSIIDELSEKYADEIAKANRVVGYNSSYRSGDYLRQLVADLYYKVGAERWGEDYDIALGGGYLSVRNPYDLAMGEVKYSTLHSIFPFDNELVLCSVSGRNLKNRFFETSNSDYFISYGEYGKEIKDNIDPYATYYIIVDTYSSQYAPNGLTVIESYGSGIFARDLLADYIEAGGLR